MISKLLMTNIPRIFQTIPLVFELHNYAINLISIANHLTNRGYRTITALHNSEAQNSINIVAVALHHLAPLHEVLVRLRVVERAYAAAGASMRCTQIFVAAVPVCMGSCMKNSIVIIEHIVSKDMPMLNNLVYFISTRDFM